MILLYCENITPRVEYITRFLLEDICGFSLKITYNESEYQAYHEASINYSNKSFSKKEIQISPASLLFEDLLKPVTPRIEKKGNQIEFFLPVKNPDQWVHDPFAASFFLVSRYEEYFPFTPSKYNSYEAESSVIYQQGILNRPVVNEWAEHLKKRILEKFPSLLYKANKFTPVISIDIDQAYAFRHRGWSRNLLSLFRNIVLFKGKLLSAQFKTLLLKQQDPYDTYEYLKKMQSDSKLSFLYFVNLGSYSAFDKNLDVANPAMKKLLTEINTYAPVGIHPSYFSNEQPEKFISEKKSLEHLLGSPVQKSRQHYLKVKLPDTYQHLLKAGITEEYTMGYGTYPGFRAGTCTPFYWFDLSKKITTRLKVYPITFMEGTFGEDLGKNPAQAIVEMKKFIDEVKKHNGYFLCIWHNQTVNDRFFWKGWKQVFEQMIEKIKEEF